MFFKVILGSFCREGDLAEFKEAFPFAQGYNLSRSSSYYTTANNISHGYYCLNNESSWINILDPDDVFSVTYVKMYQRFSIVLNNKNGNYPMLSEGNDTLILLDKDYLEKFEEFIKLEPGTLTSEALKREIDEK